MIREYTSLLKPLLLSSGKRSLTSDELLKLFKVVWSPEGSNSRECEEAVIYGWTNYVHSCAGEIHGDASVILLFFIEPYFYTLLDVLLRYWTCGWCW